MRPSGLPLAASGSRANNTPCQTPLCPKRRPPRPQQPIFSVFHRGGLHFERRTLRRPKSAQASTAIRVARSRNSIEYLRRPGIPNLQSGLRHSPQYPGHFNTLPDAVVPKTQTTSPTTAHFQRFSPRWSALLAPHHHEPQPHCLKTGETTSLEPRHAGDTPPASS